MKTITDFLVNYNYVPTSKEINIVNFQYKGVDRSLLYKYVLSPVAEFSLKFTPRTIAPNTLTIISFMMVVIPHLIYLFMFGTKFEGYVPRWLIILTTIMYFGYMNLDNIDGKQARRTGNSSPLGALLDHQMDSMVVILMSITVSTTMQFGANVFAFFLFAISASQFYLNTMEAHYTGILDLPIINGASEGTFSVALFMIFSINGYDWWQNPISFLNDIAFAKFLEILFVILFTFTSGQIFLNIKSFDRKLLPTCIKSALFGAFIIWGTAFIVAFTQVSETHTKQLFYLGGFTFTSQCGIMQLYHVANVHLPIVRIPGIILIGLPLLNTIIWNITKHSMIDQGNLINFCAFIAFLCTKNYQKNSINSLSDKYVQTIKESAKDSNIQYSRQKSIMSILPYSIITNDSQIYQV